jgi:branched-subunit amino acid transport protein
MANLWLILAVAVVTYATRVSGLWLGRRGRHTIPPAVDRFLGYVPIAAFAALIVPDVADGPGALPARLLGVLAAAFVVARIGALWAGLAVGIVSFWVVQFFLFGGL